MKYPLRLSYVPKSYIWGGQRLSGIYGKRTDDESGIISETWELTVRRGEMSVILNGPDAGRTLGNYLVSSPESVYPGFDGGRFPLLIKFIDARDRLSVQVHPDDGYAARVENDLGKTEMWYIIDAEPGAEIVYGLAPGITPEDFSAAVGEGQPIEGMLNHVKVKAGDWFFIPSGMLHAIGKGLLIAEIQQNSDLTYRVYDYGRLGADGRPRQLHTEKAADVIKAITPAENERGTSSPCGGTMADCRYFTTALLNISGDTERFRDEKSFESLICTFGSGKIICGGIGYDVGAGDSWFIPAGLGAYTLSGKMTLISSSVK